MPARKKIEQKGEQAMQITREGKKKAESPQFALYLQEKEKELASFEQDARNALRWAEIALALSGWTLEEKPPEDEFTNFLEHNMEEIQAIDMRAKDSCRKLATQH
jgi:hypothetical protein